MHLKYARYFLSFLVADDQRPSVHKLNLLLPAAYASCSSVSKWSDVPFLPLLSSCYEHLPRSCSSECLNGQSGDTSTTSRHLCICYDQTVGIAPSAACDRDIANRLMTCAVISMDSPFHFAHCNCCFRSSSRQLMTVDPTLRTTLSPTV
ncbi:ATP-dependent helicase brm [Trichinella pseudospiralis]